MKINDAGLQLIKEFEGCRLTAYKCPAGVWTIGYGHTRDVERGDKINEDLAESLLRLDLIQFENAVTDRIRIPLTENQFSALVSFSFNVGTRWMRNNSGLYKKLIAKDYQGAANRMLLYNKAGGKTLRGLTRRREAERELFLK